MAEIKYQTDKWGGREGFHHIEFEINGKTFMVTVDNDHIHVIGAPFDVVDTSSCNSAYMLPPGTRFKTMLEYHQYVDDRMLWGEDKALLKLEERRSQNGSEKHG